MPYRQLRCHLYFTVRPPTTVALENVIPTFPPAMKTWHEVRLGRVITAGAFDDVQNSRPAPSKPLYNFVACRGAFPARKSKWRHSIALGKEKKGCRNPFFVRQFLFSRVRLVRQRIRYFRVELERSFLVHGAAASMRPSFPPPSLPVRDECVELSSLRVSGPETTVLSAMGATGGSGGGGIWFFSERLRLPLCCLGVFVCYFWYGVLQETM